MYYHPYCSKLISSILLQAKHILTQRKRGREWLRRKKLSDAKVFGKRIIAAKSRFFIAKNVSIWPIKECL